MRRYDRSVDDAGHARRIHQEDFCQALGLPFTRKYEREGGPGLVEIHSVLETRSPDPIADTRSLLRWQIFCLLAGNSDGHAKNLSLLYDGATPRLAPFYDLVCTRPYGDVTQRLALSIGGNDDPGQIAGAHWRRLAEDLGVAPTFVLGLVTELVETMPDALDEAAQEFGDAYGDLPVLQMVLPAIRRQVRRSGTLLSTGG